MTKQLRNNYFVLSAEELGIKELLPPYLGAALQPNDLLTGVSFASGGCGFDPLTPKIAVPQISPLYIIFFIIKH